MAGRMIDEPVAGIAYNRVLDAVGRLENARRHADSVDVGAPRPRTAVTALLLDRLSRSPRASGELKRYAAHVAAGDTTWDRIEIDARPIPPEVSELRADPMVDWPANWPIEPDDQPYRIPWQ
ncbi:hypothetical protein [Rhodococcoides kyotonense]|uniref:hypothetical protein n=1 Tax=Rhodococcoides kyotonense TaxID=398843 RepID=UPI0020B8AA9E|nr:hypothetical protein [Rhodococcus kyotonensis]